MFAVEEKSSSRYIGRVGPYCPPEWPGFEVGWGIAKEYRSKGYAVEAARAAIDFVFANFTVDRIIHCIDPANVASQAVARRLGAVNEGPGKLEGDVVDIWVTQRSRWPRDGS
jgi:RimJ/RimL family protein N-acetyltransferase